MMEVAAVMLVMVVVVVVGASERSAEDQAIPQLRQLGSSGVRRHLKCNDSTPSPHTQDISHEDGTYKRSDFTNSGS